MLHHHRLQLRRRHLVALVLDHLLGPVDDVDVAVLVHAGDVAAAQPAVRPDRLGGGFGVLPVAAHHLRPEDQQLARLARRQLLARIHVDDLLLCVRHRWADGRGLDGVQGAGVGERAGLGHAVALENGAAEALGGQIGHLPRQRRRSREDVPQRREVVLVQLRVVGQPQQRRRHHEEVAHLVLLDQLQRPVGVESGHDQAGSAADQGGVEEHHQPIDVIEGQKGEEDGVFADQPGPQHLTEVGGQVVVGEHHALGQPRRPAGVGEHRQVLLRVDVDGLRLRRFSGHQLPDIFDRVGLAHLGQLTPHRL